MNFAWFVIGVVVGQAMVVLAGYLGELLKERREELEQIESLKMLEEKWRNELH